MILQSTNERGPNPKKTGNLPRWTSVLVVCISLICMAACSGKGDPKAARSGQPNRAQQSTPVAAVSARKGDMPVYLPGLGSVVPLNTATVKSRVDGQLVKLLYHEGQVVRAGDLLAEIDPRPFQVQLMQAEGALSRDMALLQNAKLDLERYKDLIKRDLIPKQQVDTQASLVAQYEGAVKADQGQIDNAKLQLVYARITAPISGRVGLRQVDLGNIVHATDQNGLVVITQLQPISVIFSLPEDNIGIILNRLRSGARLAVEAFDRDQKQKLATGMLLTVDNQIDPNTGTVKLKATFPNAHAELFPNQFVNARLLVDVKRGTVLVPAPALQRGPQGTFVYVVKPDNTAEVRKVTVDLTQEGEAAIASGLAPGELVVVEGADRLREGGKVELKTKPTGTGTQQRPGKPSTERE